MKQYYWIVKNNNGHLIAVYESSAKATAIEAAKQYQKSFPGDIYVVKVVETTIEELYKELI